MSRPNGGPETGGLLLPLRQPTVPVAATGIALAGVAGHLEGRQRNGQERLDKMMKHWI